MTIFAFQFGNFVFKHEKIDDLILHDVCIYIKFRDFTLHNGQYGFIIRSKMNWLDIYERTFANLS